MEKMPSKAFSIKITALKYVDVWHLNNYITTIDVISMNERSKNIFFYLIRWTYQIFSWILFVFLLFCPFDLKVQFYSIIVFTKVCINNQQSTSLIKFLKKGNAISKSIHWGRERGRERGRQSFSNFIIKFIIWLPKDLGIVKIMRLFLARESLRSVMYIFWQESIKLLVIIAQDLSRSYIARRYLRLLPLSISNHDARPSYIVFCRILKVSAKLVAICCKLKWFGKKSPGRKLQRIPLSDFPTDSYIAN